MIRDDDKFSRQKSVDQMSLRDLEGGMTRPMYRLTPSGRYHIFENR